MHGMVGQILQLYGEGLEHDGRINLSKLLRDHLSFTCVLVTLLTTSGCGSAHTSHSLLLVSLAAIINGFCNLPPQPHSKTFWQTFWLW
jgi:hypothetical protein